MGNSVVVRRSGVQMRSADGRYAPKIVPPAVATSIARGRKRPEGTNEVVPVDVGRVPVTKEGIVHPPGDDSRSGPSYTVIGPR